MTLPTIPRDRDDDYGAQAIAARRTYAEEQTGARLEHVSSYSLEPSTLPGNIENFLGVTQVPTGLAGPLLVNGEHAHGEFLVPLATTEGTLVASYSRGMKLCRAAGGITTTVLDDRMQRAPVFSFASAREARDFKVWLDAHVPEVAAAAEATTGTGKLLDIQTFGASKLLYTRFNYSTGDAAGQNLTGKATFAACAWIKQHYPGELHFLLEGQFATDKKTSVVNMLHTRGKRVVAEITLPAALVEEQMHVSTDKLYAARMRGQLGSIMSVTNNNGNHSAKGSPRSSSPPARTSPTWRSPRRSTASPSCCPTGTSTPRRPCPPSSWRRTAAARAWPRSGSAWSCSAATAAAGS